MLTERARYEREWGRFPELAKVLSDKQPTAQWTGLTSVSDNIFDQVVRLLRIYSLVEDNGAAVDSALAGREQLMRGELFELSEGLAWAADRFAEASRRVGKRAGRG